MKTSSRFNLLSLIVAGLATIFASANAANAGEKGEIIAAASIVTNTNDSGAGSLRQALVDAVDGDTITFNIPSPPSTITLTSAQLTIDKNITISGPGADVLTVQRDSGASAFRIFQVNPGHNVIIKGLTISNGAADSFMGFGGGGIHNDHSTLTVKSCALSGNYTVGNYGIGGGILNDASSSGNATLIVADSTLSGNSTTGLATYGGGIGSISCGGPCRLMLAVVNSTLSGNSGGTLGGSGGGIANLGSPFDSAIVANSTLSGNSVDGYGGGIYNGEALTVANSTLSGNSAGALGDGIFNQGPLTLSNTVLKTGASGVNIYPGGTVTSLGYNLSSDNGGGFLTATGDQINIDPMLGPLQDNGGPTFTHAPLSNSPAIDRGKDIGVTGRDQRGSLRPVTYDGSITPPAGGDRSDIGAVELPLSMIPTPTPPPMVNVSGNISYCSNPVPGPVPNVTLTLTGEATTSTMTDGSGNYQFSLPSDAYYIVTPSKAARAPGSPGINTVDVIATQRHYLNLGTPLAGCRLTAADVNADNAINTVDVIAIQRFFLGLSTGIASAGKYKFTPATRMYLGIVSDRTGQNYDALIFGDVASGFVHRPEGPAQDAAGDDMSASEVPATVTTLSLPNVAVDAFVTNFTVQVTTTAIDARNKLVGFQGDFSFDERVATFQSEPVQKAGMTGGNWNVSGNVLPGAGPIRTLRISAFSNDFTPLSGWGTLFKLRMTRVSKAAQGTPLLWAAPPDQFIFIDADLHTQKPGNAAPGSVTSSGKRK